MEQNHKNPIPEWAEDDRPREKMLLRGKAALTDAELIAILLRSGNHHESAVELAQRLLSKTGNSLPALSRMTYKELCDFKGIGEAKALSVIAALELGNRRRLSDAGTKKRISSSNDAFQILAPLLSDSPYEEFWVLLLNRANQVISYKCVSEGGLSGTVADPKKIFKLALEHYAAAVILCHNHPSGNLIPSEQDKNLTEKMSMAGKFLEIQVLDHLIIGINNYYSFADSGILS